MAQLILGLSDRLIIQIFNMILLHQSEVLFFYLSLFLFRIAIFFFLWMSDDSILFIIILVSMTLPHVSILMEEADKLLSEQKISQATQIYKIAIKSNSPEQQHKILGLGSVQHQKGHYLSYSIDFYLELVAAKGASNPYDALSFCFSSGSQYEQANQYYRQMIAEYPENQSLKFGLATIYHNQGKIQEAISEYEAALAHSRYNQAECLRELVLLSFANRDFEKCHIYLNRIRMFPQQIQAEAIEAYLTSDQQQSLIKLKELINQHSDYAKLYLFLASIYQQKLQESNHAIELYENCIRVNAQTHRIYFSPYICLAKLYRKLFSYEKSVQTMRRLIERGGDNWLCQLFLAEDYFKLSRAQQSLQCLRACLIDLPYNSQIYLSEANRSFMLKEISENVRKAEQNLIYYKSNRQMSLSQHLHSIFEEDINVNITNLRMNNPNLFEFLRQASQNPHQSNALQHIYNLFSENEINLQLVDIFCCNYVLKSLIKHEISLSAVCQQLQAILTKKVIENEVQVYSEIEQTRQKNEYKIKVKGRLVDAFASKQISTYFSKYSHLFIVIKKISQKVRKIRPELQLLLKTVKSNSKLSVVDERIIAKIDDENEWICINEVIQELLPQTLSKQHSFLKEAEREFATSYHKSLPELTALMIQKWQEAVTRVLEQRREEKRQIRCEIADWATVELVFPSQTRLILGLEEIKKWCEECGASIVGVEGHLEGERELRLKVAIKDICCTIKLQVNYGLKLKRFQKAISSIIGSHRNVIFSVFLNANKHHQHSLLSYLKEVAHHFELSRIPAHKQTLLGIQSFISGMDCIQNWDQFSRYQKLRLSESWIHPNKGKRHAQRLLTEVEGHFVTTHQIRREQSVQTEVINPAELMQQFKPKQQSLLRTFSQNNINRFLDQRSDLQHSLRQPSAPSKRSMFLQSSCMVQASEPKARPAFFQLPQHSSSKCFEGLQFKRINSEHESEHQMGEMQPNSEEDIPICSAPARPVDLKEVAAQNERLRRYIQAIQKEQSQLIDRHIGQIAQRQQEITNLSDQLGRAATKQAELQSCINSIKDKYEQMLAGVEGRASSIQKTIEQAYNTIKFKNAEIQSLKAQILRREKDIATLKNNQKQQSESRDVALTSTTASFKQAQIHYLAKLKGFEAQNFRLKERVQELMRQNQSRKGEMERQQEDINAKLLTFSQVEGELEKQIFALKSQNDELSLKSSQIASSLHEMREQLVQTVSLKEEEHKQAAVEFRLAELQLNAEIERLKTEYSKQSSRASSCGCLQSKSAGRRLQYLKILFTILLLEAITVSFTLNLFR